MATTVLPNLASAVPTPGILTLKDFQQKNGIGPWMTQVRIVRLWHESDFMRTNDGDLIHAIVQKKFIWKFEPLLEEGMLLCLNNLTFNDYHVYFNWNTDITTLETTSASIPRHKFNFTEFENLAAAAANTYLTGVLTSHTNLQQLKRNSGNTCFMHELTLENIRIKVTLWGDSTSSLPELQAHKLNPDPQVVAVVAGVYVKEYLGKASFSSTNSTKIYFDLDSPEVLHTRERSSHRTPPLEITVPARVGYNQAIQSIVDTRKSISR
ncbi:hypothetical protein MKW92_036829 [Papaver armeniacum]|nr:hypothetical protein MKW92_036829 [Papaver armeniacum]